MGGSERLGEISFNSGWPDLRILLAKRCLKTGEIVPWVDYGELRRRLDMEEVLGWMDWRSNSRKGEYLRGSCPLCGDGKSPKARHFVVHVSRKLFKCFGCDEGGDVLVL